MSEEQKEKWYKAFTREQLIERCEYLQRSCERKENSIMELEMELADLENIINKAIEYIENKNKFLDRENYYQVFEYRDIYLIPLLDILKGVDKE